MTPKEQVLAWVRKSNPYTMELKDGCVVRYVFPHGQIAMQGVFIGKGGHYGNAELLGLRVQNCVMPIPNKNHFEKTVEILGSDMGLQELLIAANSVKKHHGTVEYREDGAWFCFYEHDPDLFISRLECSAWIDLTKDLHSQSDEFYSNLLPLLS